jgi:hypothetical protein
VQRINPLGSLNNHWPCHQQNSMTNHATWISVTGWQLIDPFQSSDSDQFFIPSNFFHA